MRTLAKLIFLSLIVTALGADEIEPTRREKELRAACQRIANKLASVGLEECLDSGLLPSDSSSVLDVPILVKDYPPIAGRTPWGRVLLIGGIHGDEYSSVSVVFKWLATLNTYHSGLFQWRISPLMNPDGLLRPRSRRMNANGVDLNRNFPCPDWHTSTQDYWLRRTSSNPRRYPGPGPLSEPESRWLAEEIESFDPDVIISVHAPHGLVDFDGPPHPPDKLGPLELKLLGTYPGSLGRFAGVYRNIPVLTIELASATSMPKVSDQRRIWRDLIRWLKDRLPGPVKRLDQEGP